MLVEPLRHVNNPDFGCVLFRRTYSQIRAEGSVWDQAAEIYPYLGAVPNETKNQWVFPSGATVTMSHLQHEKDIHAWQGAQIPLILWDELTHFTEKQFFYLLSRSRSMCGVRPYVRASTNPQPHSFVHRLIEWYLDPEGYPIPERSGAIRWFVREDGQLHWADTREELLTEFPDSQPKSFTFVASKLQDNQILMKQDPGYLANLMAQDAVTRAQLLDGCWLAVQGEGIYFSRDTLQVRPSRGEPRRLVRAWDFAATEPSASNRDPDWCVGALLASNDDGTVGILDIQRFRLSPSGVEARIKATAALDDEQYGAVTQLLEQEPGSAGKSHVEHYKRHVLRGHAVRSERPTGDKVTRSLPASAAAENGLLWLLRGAWNDVFLMEAEQFPDGSHDDQVDAVSSGYRFLTKPAVSGKGGMI